MMSLTQAAAAVKGNLAGPDVKFHAVTTDSRKAAAGDLFIALKGERFDGHEFVQQCFDQGAVAAMVQHQVEAQGSLLLVGDTRLALGELAAAWRDKFDIPLAAVTGSNGKTTVKEMLAAILRNVAGANGVLATEGNLNNDIGLPLTLLKLRQQHHYAIAEMGMNHAGEISYLARIAKPTVALINNAMPAHLEGLGSIEAVAQAKGEIFEGLATDGTAVINADDTHAALWKQLARPHRQMTFGLQHTADVSADYLLRADGSELQLNTPQGNARVKLVVAGLHNVRNALAAAAAALGMGVQLPAIAAGLESFGGIKGRLQRKPGKCGATVIDDTYNANPASVHAAIEVLAGLPGKKILVLGDMGELGMHAAELHAEIGCKAKSAGIDLLFALGKLSCLVAETFGPGASHYETAEKLVAELDPQLTAQTTVLVKGSRFMRMEQVVEAITHKEESNAA